MFVLLGFVPWLILLAVSVVIVIATELDENKWATVSMFTGAGAVIWLTHSNPLPWLASHWLLLLVGFAGYFVLGIVWGFFKWYLFNLNIRDKLADGTLKIRDTVKPQDRWGSNYVDLPISPKKNKTRIVGWMTYWPWSFVWFIINDPVRRAWNAIYNRLVAKLEAVSKHVFKNFVVEKPPAL